MAFLNYFSSLFFITLGITFMLILFLVYHYRQRISTLEHKTDTMYNILNSSVKEMIVMKGHIQQIFHRISPVGPSSVEMDSVYLQPETAQQIFSKGGERDEETEDEGADEETDDDRGGDYYDRGDDEGADEETDDDRGGADDEESDDDEIIKAEPELPDLKTQELEKTEEDGDKDLEVEDLPEQEIVLEKDVDSPTIDSPLDIIIPIVEEVVETFIEKVIEPISVSIPSVIDYQKHNVAELRKIASSKKIHGDVSKLKRNELLKILENSPA